MVTACLTIKNSYKKFALIENLTIFLDIMYLWVALGNPGERYKNSRHNMGVFIIEKILSLSETNSFSVKERKKLKSLEYIQDRFQNVKIIFPQTFMNFSGESVKKACSFYQCSLENVIVFHDEIELPPGEVRHKFSGGHSGHNGIRDIILKVGSPNFHRIRLGVGRPSEDKQIPKIADYLLETTNLEGMINPRKVLGILQENFPGIV